MNEGARHEEPARASAPQAQEDAGRNGAESSVPRRRVSWADQVVVTGVFALLGWVALYWFVRFAEPPEREVRAPPRRDYDETRLVQALSDGGWESRLRDIHQAGQPRRGERAEGRYSGSPGCYRVEELIRRTFAGAGLEVVTQELDVVVPETETCAIADENGKPLPEVTLYPLQPSGLLPISLPPGGITGRLVFCESPALRHLPKGRPEEMIVVIPLDSASDWMPLASCGVLALVAVEDEVGRRLRPNPDVAGPWNTLVSSAEVGFPRFLARGPLARYAGQTVTVQCRTVWREKPVRNVLGRLRCKRATDEALIVTAFYDSSSVVPEIAPGAEQSVSLAILLELAQAVGLYRDALTRDVIFVATAGHAQGLAGVSALLDALGPFGGWGGKPSHGEERAAEHRERIEWVRLARERLQHMARISPAAHSSPLQEPTLPRGFSAWWEQRFLTVAGDVYLRCRDEALERRLEHLRAGSPVFREGFDPTQATEEERRGDAHTHPLLRAYLEARRREQRAAALLGMKPEDAFRAEEFVTWDYEARLRAHLDAMESYHRRQLHRTDDAAAVRRLLGEYRATLTVNLELYSGGSRNKRDLALVVGVPRPGSVVEPQATELAAWFSGKEIIHAQPLGFEIVTWGARDIEGSKERPNRVFSQQMADLESEAWFHCGRLAFTLANYDFFPEKVGTPEDTLDDLPLAGLRLAIPAVGRGLLAIAFGNLPFKPLRPKADAPVSSVNGRVVTSAGASTLVPSHPMTERIFVRVVRDGLAHLTLRDVRGIDPFPPLAVSPYGEYRRDLMFEAGYYGSVTVVAAGFDEEGRLRFFKDEALSGKGGFLCTKVPSERIRVARGQRPYPIHVPVFRCTPVALYDRGNPRTLKSFKDVAILARQGLTIPASGFRGSWLNFLDPALSFYVGFLDGAAENPQVQTYRAFMLNVDPSEPLRPDEPEIHGQGYLAADTERLLVPHFDAAASLLRTAEKRLALQRQYGMADEQMLGFHHRGIEWLEEGRRQWEKGEAAEAVVAAGTALAYAINNHPVIRARISQAVTGILWYLGLLVPFVFFAEKLLFGFTDIRKQLLGMGGIFLSVFLLLRCFHPAFQMVRSSLVILLGFLIFLLTVLVTLMVGGKFRQSLRELRRREGRLEGADIHRAGVLGTAFMLGLNNMRRRKVRTGLTCTALILITCAMICFTSVSTDIVDVEYPTGRSAWNGIMVRNENYETLTEAEISALRHIYGDRFPMAVWQWLSPNLSVYQQVQVQNPEIMVDREEEVAGVRTVRRTRLAGCLRSHWCEPEFTGMDRWLLTRRGWFPRSPETRQEKLDAVAAGYREVAAVMLPEPAARDLGITPEMVDAGGVRVSLRGEEYEVWGILNPEGMERGLGLDGRPLLPYDLNTVQTLGQKGTRLVVPEDVGRLAGSQVLVVNRMPPLKPHETVVNVACGILFPRRAYRVRTDLPEQPPMTYREQRRVVLEYLERIGEPAYYAVDGVSYYGSRRRGRSLAGWMEMAVPVLIAALTVFNTMRSSVYERRDEIYVYNAVGVAPHHVFFIFMAEACVYAVIGALAGYLLSQAIGRGLTAVGWTSGLNLDYSSIETIYASLALVAATLLSTLLPARNAARMASPAEAPSWAVPEAEGDNLALRLPFTFTRYDRIAVLAYFFRWLEANGSGSSGPFFCGFPHCEIRHEAGPRGPEWVPVLRCTVWLKPYDLGVSQEVEIALPTDSETGEYIARVQIRRLSGHLPTWCRRVRPFLGVLRKQFLHWRVTTRADREEMYREAVGLLQRAVALEGELRS